ncbi:hypothetical protein IC232_27130 [Microvirga sp. BT688]|uniref:hypothetical protein n=1 Tax=Microvirga sp. TaxID=1873136 RepID=UPI0016854089|nr:hypothetical protein [Microvirga sp.]MBD2750337.1 hypothetical protein [Microvirga sp.]
MLLSIMVGSIVSRATTGNGSAIGLHWLFSGIATFCHRFKTLVRDKSRVLIRKGDLDIQVI